MKGDHAWAWLAIAVAAGLSLLILSSHAWADTPADAASEPRAVIVVHVENKDGKKFSVRYDLRDFETKAVCQKYLDDQKQQADPEFVKALEQLQLLLDQNNAWPTSIECLPGKAKEDTSI